ncbi:hypothetical protein HII36_05150 [Nonomuraea sp. NN258]|uniref:hypothetical protein n=1 Tax=Nonomuraea antri TaxID=2730852 RepID=UPI0015696BDF|nr:hypothetical protein [Nonomuraea antri]NRQ31223.1 hypothetical protein [Nonomuraea antri]
MNLDPKTRTGRRQLARNARAYGYYDIPASPGQGRQFQVDCPLCRQRVSAAWESGTTRIALLDAAMDDHLLHDCEHGPQQ